MFSVRKPPPQGEAYEHWSMDTYIHIYIYIYVLVTSVRKHPQGGAYEYRTLGPPVFTESQCHSYTASQEGTQVFLEKNTDAQCTENSLIKAMKYNCFH